jgi:hypothetical protein
VELQELRCGSATTSELKLPNTCIGAYGCLLLPGSQYQVLRFLFKMFLIGKSLFVSKLESQLFYSLR